MPSVKLEINGKTVTLEGSEEDLDAALADLSQMPEATQSPSPNYPRMAAEMLGGMVGGATAVIAGNAGPQAFTPEEIATVPVATGLGATIGGQTYDALHSFFTPEDAEGLSVADNIGQASMDFLANSVGARAGELLGPIASKGLSRIKGAGRASSDAVADAFRTIGIRPTAGAVGGKTIAGVENALAKLPFSADIVGADYARVIDGMGDFARQQAGRLSETEGRQSVGRTVKRGVEGFVNRFTTKAGELYASIPIKSAHRSMPSSYYSQLEKIGGEFAEDPEYAAVLSSNIIKQLQSVAGKGATTLEDGTAIPKELTWGTIKALRTRVGQMLDDKQLIGSGAQGDLKQLYGALSEDMTRIAGEHSPDALQAMKRANTFWRAGRGRIDEVLNPLVRTAIEEDVYASAIRGARFGVTRLKSLRQSLKPGEWDSVVAQTVRDMGRALPGAQDEAVEIAPTFSPATFVTNYAKMAENGATRVLFGGERYRGLDAAMQSLLKASSGVKEAAKLANTSNTAGNQFYMGLLTAGGGAGALVGSSLPAAVGGGALALVTPPTAAKLLTSPSFVRWLAKGASTPATKSGISAHMGQLSAITASEEAMLEPIAEYLAALEKTGVSPSVTSQPGLPPPTLSPTLTP